MKRRKSDEYHWCGDCGLSLTTISQGKLVAMAARCSELTDAQMDHLHGTQTGDLAEICRRKQGDEMTDAIEVAKAESDALRQEAEAALPEIKDFFVTNDDDKEFAADLLREVKDKYKTVESRRKEITVPLNAALRSVNDMFKPVLKALEESERLLKSKIVDYVELREKERKVALLEAAQTKNAKKATEALEKATITSAPEGVNIRYRHVFEIVDPDLVPREFCSPDLKKIGACVGKEIPGVIWGQEPIVSARSK